MIRITCGANTEEVNGMAGKTLGEVRKGLQEVLNIPREVQAISGGTHVDDKHVLAEGESIEFVKPAGDKG